MRKITIVGAGQAGLQLGLGLLEHGYDVTLITNRTGDQIRDGKVMSSQCMFDTALSPRAVARPGLLGRRVSPGRGRRAHGPDPRGRHRLLVGGPSRRTGQLGRPAGQDASLDRRVREPRRQGRTSSTPGSRTSSGTPPTATSSSSPPARATSRKLFERDADRSQFDKPQRALALTYVNGLTPREDHSAVSFNLIPGVGEYFVFPALTTTGPCEIMVFEGIPGGPDGLLRRRHQPAGTPGALQGAARHLPAVGGRALPATLN